MLFRRVSPTASILGAILAVAAYPTGAFAADGDVRANSLQVAEAVAEALERNPNLLAAREELGVAQAQLAKAKYPNAFNPELGGAAANRRFDGGGSEVQPSAELSLEVEVAGQRGKRIDAAKRNLEHVQADVDDASRLLREQVQQAFYRALYARERQRLATEVEELTRRVSDASEARFRAGEVPKMEPNISRIRLSQGRRDLLTAEREYADTLREVERLLGREPRGTLVLDGDLRLDADVALEADGLLKRALRERPDLRAQTAEVARVEAEQALTRRLAFPNVTFSAFYEEEAEADGGRDRIVGGGLTIPLPLFDRQQAELASLAAHRSQAQHQRHAATLAVRGEVEDAVRAYRTALESARVYEADALDLIDENFRFMEASYREGKIGLLEMTVVQNDLIEARASYLESLSDYWLSRFALERAIGGSPFQAGDDK